MKQGWEIKTLSEIGKVYNGNSINEKVKKDNYSDLEDGFPFIATKDISYESEIDYDNGIKIPFVEKSSFKTAPKNTVLICAEGGSAGRKIGFTNQEVCFGNKLFALATNKNVESRYVYYYYFSDTFQKHFAVELAGIIGGVSMNKFKDLEIPLPPLPEQQRIVAILDEAFTAIDKAKANAEQNLKNAKELFESYLQELLENGDWEEKTLGQLSKNKDAVVSGPFGSNLKVSDYKTEGVPILRLQNIGKGYFINKSIKYITKQKAEELKYHSFVAGDIALAKLGIPIGKTCIIPENFKSGIITADIVRIRPDLNVVNYKFLENFLNTSLSVSQLTGNISGATRPRVNLSDVRNIVIKLPPLKEQENIVKKLDSLSLETKRLEAIYQTKINDLEELKKSLLQKAFSGELKTAKALV